MLKRRYVYFRHPCVAGIYYYDGNTYFKNQAGRHGKIIIMMPAKKEKGHQAVN